MSKVVHMHPPKVVSPEERALSTLLTHHSDLVRVVGTIDREHFPDNDGFTLHFHGDRIPEIDLENGATITAHYEMDHQTVTPASSAGGWKEFQQNLAELKLRLPAAKREAVTYCELLAKTMAESMGYRLYGYHFEDTSCHVAMDINHTSGSRLVALINVHQPR